MFFHLYDTTKSEFLKFKCIEKMSQMTIALVNMYNLLPQIAQNVPIELKNNNIDYDKDLSVYWFALVITITAWGWCYLLKKKHSNLILDFVCGESSIFEEILRSNKSDCTKLILAIGKGHLQSLVSKRLLGINPKFEKLIIALRTAYARDLILDKEQTSYPDILDALRLNLLNYPLRRGWQKKKELLFFLYYYFIISCKFSIKFV